MDERAAPCWSRPRARGRGRRLRRGRRRRARGSDDRCRRRNGGGGAAIKVGLVTDIGGLNDRSFNHLAYVGLKRAE